MIATEVSEIRQQMGTIALLVATIDPEELARELVRVVETKPRNIRDYLFIHAFANFQERVASWQDDADYGSTFNDAYQAARVRLGVND